MPVLHASGVVKSLGAGRSRQAVLRGVDLEVEPGELVAIVGSSGSGKSTLLHLLGALDRPDDGVIHVAGVPVHRAGDSALTSLRLRRIGFVFQFFHLVPELTGQENVLLAARLVDGRSLTRGRELVGRLGLAQAAGRRPHELSGGEQQRFAIARALVNDPAVVLADEPTGNLDAASGAAVLALLRAAADDGRAVVLVTHDLAATGLADRVLELREGRLP